MTLSPTSLPDASHVVVTLIDKRQELVKVSRLPSVASINIQQPHGTIVADDDDGFSPITQNDFAKGDSTGRLLEYRCTRYLYSSSAGTFLPVPSMPSEFVDELHAAATARRVKGQTIDEWLRTHRRSLYGQNELVIPVKSPLELLGEEMTHPFYVFQYVSVAIWCLEAYYSYSLIIISITMFSILTTVFQTYRYRQRLAALAHYVCEVHVMQAGGAMVTTSSTELVPGDIVAIHPGLLPCDVVLLRGEAIVDENMLTGEAVPVRKVAYSPSNDDVSMDNSNTMLRYDPDVHKGCTLYGGTTIAQARPGGAERMALGVVVRTSFWTAKGQLLKSILFPRQHKETFASDAIAFIAVMLSLGLAFYVWDIVALASYGAPAGFIILRYLDLITVAVPPALPACLTVATAIAVSRLAEHGIFVSNPSAIAAAGHLDVICFDKTGTLTEPGLDLKGIVPVTECRATQQQHAEGDHVDKMAVSISDKNKEDLPSIKTSIAVHASDAAIAHSKPTPGLVLQAMQQPMAIQRPRCMPMCSNDALPVEFQETLATCHGLAQLNGELVGDPLDQRLFTATAWVMLDDGAGAPVEIVTVADEGYFDEPVGMESASSSYGLTGSTPRHRVPGSPGVLTTAHVRTKVAPPPGRNLGIRAVQGAYTIVRRFEFSAEKQRNVVVVSHPDGTMHVHVKGSPEMVRKLSDPSSIPEDFDSELAGHTREGLRVLGLARRALVDCTEAEVQSLTQEELERGARFLGFAVMINPLRDDTAAVLESLQDAGIRTVMVTGDHARTAVSVAHQCGMMENNKNIVYLDTENSEGRVEDTSIAASKARIDGSTLPLNAAEALRDVANNRCDTAVTGRGFERLLLDAANGSGGGLDTALHKAGVFARMSPDDKRLLMELLGEGTVAENGEETAGLGHHVGFCGDGANDVGALKSAHVGVSLCEAEASVAAPLTSKKQTISCMIAVVAEGRCSLDTSYLIFKFIIVYAFVQVFAVNLMYSFGGSVGNYQYLIQDLLYTTVLAGTMGFTRPAKKLTGQRPPERLMSAGIWFPVIAQFIACAVFQLASLVMLSRQSWYVRFDPEPGSTGTNCFARATANSPECSLSWENSVVFIMSLGQFLITTLVFNKGPPHRRPLYTNAWLLLGMLYNYKMIYVLYYCCAFQYSKFIYCGAAIMAQTVFLLFLVFTPGDAVSKVFAGMIPFPEAAFRWKMLGLLTLNLAGSWLIDMLSVLVWQVLRGRRVMGISIV